ncbi:hypothetical protein PM082_024497 [Marasmius tenuissimus]|nr:hypothetical protein PM082_024497 [Marasmius tenuissimus]
MALQVSFLEVPSIVSKTDTLLSGSTIPGLGSISGKAIKQLGEALLNGVDYIRVNRELTRIESHFQQSPTNQLLDIQSVEGMYHTLFELTHPGYTQSVRMRAFKIVMKRIGGMNFKDLARALVYLDSWSTTYRHLRSAIECCWRSGSPWDSDFDHHTAGYYSYRLHRREGLSYVDPMALYLTLVALLGSENHCQMILNLVSSSAYEGADARRPETQEVTCGVLKRVLKARLRLGEDDQLITDARAVLASAVLEDEPSYVYPFGHVSNILTKVTEILSLANASPINARPVLRRLTYIQLWGSPIDFPTATIEGDTTGSVTPIERLGTDTIPPLDPELKSKGIIDGIPHINLQIEGTMPSVNLNLELNGEISKKGTLASFPEALISPNSEGMYHDHNLDELHARPASSRGLLNSHLLLEPDSSQDRNFSQQTQIITFTTEAFDDLVTHGSPSSNLLGFDPSDLASQLTLMESSCYKNVRHVDCLRYIDEHVGAVSDLIDLNNTVSHLN